MRTFVGLVPPAHVAGCVVAAARAALRGAVRGTYAPEDLHLTLCFLGEVAPRSRAALAVGLAGAFDGARALRLRIGGTGAFGGAGHERVLWAGLDLDAAERAGLDELVERARALARASGLALDAVEADRPFTPHLSLARPRAPEIVPEAFRALRFDVDWIADAVHVHESPGATRAGTRYPVIATHRLRSL